MITRARVLLALDESQGDAPDRRVVAGRVGTSESTAYLVARKDVGTPTAVAVRYELLDQGTRLGGWVDLSSGPRGTTLILSVPLNSAELTAVIPTKGERSADRTSQWDDL